MNTQFLIRALLAAVLGFTQCSRTMTIDRADRVEIGPPTPGSNATLTTRALLLVEGGCAAYLVEYTPDQRVLIAPEVVKRFGRRRIEQNVRAAYAGSERAQKFLNHLARQFHCVQTESGYVIRLK